ncbi:MAG: MarP family serine protease [Micrococcaceae bacterium]
MELTHGLDFAVLFIFCAQLIVGYRQGLIVSTFNLLGAIAGVFLAALCVPAMMKVVDETFDLRQYRFLVVVIDIIFMILLTQAVTTFLGNYIKKRIKAQKLHKIDKVTGCLVNGTVVVLLFSVLSTLIASKNIATVNNILNTSSSFALSQKFVPAETRKQLSTLTEDTFRKPVSDLAQTLYPPIDESTPQGPSTTNSINQEKQSIVKIVSEATSCQQNKSGSGFVISPQLVMTNAHVVAGDTATQIETDDGKQYEATVIAFNSDKDIAILKVPELQAPAIAMGQEAKRGDNVIFAGYPGAGSYLSKAARVEKVGPTIIKDIYQQKSNVLSVYTLAADVRKGNSGGPLLSQDGKVIGMVFAQGIEQNGKSGYALNIQELQDVLQQTKSQNAVPTGACLKN